MEVREDVTEVDLNLAEIREMQNTQYALFQEGFNSVSPDPASIVASISGISSVVALIFLNSNAIGIAAGVIGILAEITGSEKNRLKTLVQDGHYHMQKLEDSNSPAHRCRHPCARAVAGR